MTAHLKGGPLWAKPDDGRGVISRPPSSGQAAVVYTPWFWWLDHDWSSATCRAFFFHRTKL